MEKVRITEVEVEPRPISQGFCALARCSINDAFHVEGIAVYTSPKSKLGYRLVFPARKVGEGRYVRFFYPYRREIEEVISAAVINEYLEVMDKFNYTDR